MKFDTEEKCGCKNHGTQGNKLDICGVKVWGKGEVGRIQRRGKPVTGHSCALLGIWASLEGSGNDGKVLAGW